MALSGLQIFKLLPKTNCGECGVPTCLAFAMQLAQQKAELSACPYASDEAKDVLGAASEPPMKTVKVGSGPYAFEIGGETELFRHDKTFYHQTGIFISISDNKSSDEIISKVREADEYMIERVGEKLYIDGFCLVNDSGDADKFLNALKQITSNSSRPVILKCENSEAIKTAVEELNGRKPVIFCQSGDISDLAKLAVENSTSLIVSGDNFDDLSAKTSKIAESGFKDIIIHLDSQNSVDDLQNCVILRRSALRKSFKPFGYPIIWFMEDKAPHELLADSIIGMCKYAGIIVLPSFQKEFLMTLFTVRQNIYTDPQKPIQVDPKLSAIGDPGPDSPVFVTTNFSLTYFIISGEIENAGISAWLIIPDCEGMSVLTAWAAGKFSGEKIAKFIREIDLENKVRTREIIIPGHVATISGDLEEALPGWKVSVGPQEAADLSSYIKNHLN